MNVNSLSFRCTRTLIQASVGTKAQVKEVAESTDRMSYSVGKIKDIREARRMASKFSPAGTDY